MVWITVGVLRKYLGHVVNHFVTCRPCLSALGNLYRELQHEDGVRFRLGPQSLRELRVVRGLIFQAG
eukprot:4936728-Lingulodinium_polyedra.AAC.1